MESNISVHMMESLKRELENIYNIISSDIKSYSFSDKVHMTIYPLYTPDDKFSPIRTSPNIGIYVQDDEFRLRNVVGYNLTRVEADYGGKYQNSHAVAGIEVLDYEHTIGSLGDEESTLETIMDIKSSLE